MKKILILITVLMLPSLAAAIPVRVKDLADFDGVRGNDLVGYGLVVGLDGSGDSMRNAPFTEDMLTGMLERLGVNTTGDALRSKNVAAVIVTASLPPFARSGSKIDVDVSAIGDAKSLLGGTLVMTPLKAADGNIYAVAQGSIIAGGASVTAQAARVVEGVPTAGQIPSGARVEREVEFDFSQLEEVRIALKNADFTTASRIEAAINKALGRSVAEMIDSGTILISLERLGQVSPARVVARIENVLVEPENKAVVVMDHRAGTIVMGENVRISKVAVSQGSLTLRVNESPTVSQPSPFSNGETVIVPQSYAELRQEPGIGLAQIGGETSLADVVEGLNALGVRPREMIDILKSVHSAGALHAEIIVK